MSEPEFQIYECSNLECHFRCPNNLTERKMDRCPLCGAELLPQGSPFINSKRHSEKNLNFPRVEVLLDNLRSTLNVGSIFRTADGAGIAHIYCCGTTPTPVHPKIAKTSLGAEGFTAWSYHPNALDVVREKQQQHVEILSLEAGENARSILQFSSNPPRQALLVVGNEVSGIDPEIMRISNQVLFIPMRGKKTSLNVAVAFGIAIYSILK